VQPFGGEGLSGTGPKAGGALYLQRLLATRPGGLPASLTRRPEPTVEQGSKADSPLNVFCNFLSARGYTGLSARFKKYPDLVAKNVSVTLTGPTGEKNTYSLLPRGTVLCFPHSLDGARTQFAAAIATGNAAHFVGAIADQFVSELPAELRAHATAGDTWHGDAILYEGEGDRLVDLLKIVADRRGSIVSAQALTPCAVAEGEGYVLERLLAERSVSVNTTAAGGNAQLMTSV
jgi:RHH-type proline utilization regulon transcriptional repressor/proline dehydrogenase/delta 1-pyrroline-5-carboxylate dehydrogenase